MSTLALRPTDLFATSTLQGDGRDWKDHATTHWMGQGGRHPIFPFARTVATDFSIPQLKSQSQRRRGKSVSFRTTDDVFWLLDRESGFNHERYASSPRKPSTSASVSIGLGDEPTTTSDQLEDFKPGSYPSPDPPSEESDFSPSHPSQMDIGGAKTASTSPTGLIEDFESRFPPLSPTGSRTTTNHDVSTFDRRYPQIPAWTASFTRDSRWHARSPSPSLSSSVGAPGWTNYNSDFLSEECFGPDGAVTPDTLQALAWATDAPTPTNYTSDFLPEECFDTDGTIKPEAMQELAWATGAPARTNFQSDFLPEQCFDTDGTIRESAMQELEWIT